VAAKVRDAVGPDVKLMADGNGAYTVSSAVRMGRELEALDFYWFEEPTPQPNYAGYETLCQRLDIAIAGGECLASRGEALGLLRRQAFDIIQPDVSLCGGVAECLWVAETARLFGVPAMPHCWGGAVVIAAALQVLSLLPDASYARTTEPPMLELDMIENPMRDELLTRKLSMRDGHLDVPAGPGLGVEIDEEAVRRFEVR
jgi:D-galactarolactone cycloisomerase